MVVCECNCGTVLAAFVSSLLSGHTRSCGCLSKESTGGRRRTHGGYRTRLYKCWMAMRQRCENPRDQNYRYYGGRGISVCLEWSQFGAFRDWAMASGYQEGLTIERRENDLGYEPGNCIWITQSEQMRNTRRSHRLTAFGETKLLADWARDRRCVVSVQAILGRLAKGMTNEKAIATPRMQAGRRKAGVG